METVIACIACFVIGYIVAFVRISIHEVEEESTEDSFEPKIIYFEFFNETYFAYDADHLFLGQSLVLAELIEDLVARFELIVATSSEENVKTELLKLSPKS